MDNAAARNVIDLAEFRQNRQDAVPQTLGTPPRINDGEIFSRNYATMEGLVFGVLKIREILDYHLGPDGEWTSLLMGLMDASNAWQGGAQDRLDDIHDHVLALKGLIFEAITPASHRNLSNALLLLDLIQKAPTYKRAKAAPVTPHAHV